MLPKLMLVPIFVVTTVALGADPAPSTTSKAETGTKAADTQFQAHLAGGLMLANQEEISLCQFALTRTTEPKVKELIKKMIDDHTKFLADLKKFAPQAATLQLRQRVEGGTDTQASARGNRFSVRMVSESRPAEAVGSSTPAAVPRPQSFAERLFAVDYESAQECVALNQKMLEKFKGPSFDQAFLGQQISMHIGMLARLKGASKFTTGEFQQLLKKGQETTHQHKKHAVELMEELARVPIEKSAKGLRH